MQSPAISIQDVRFRYGDRVALDGINQSIAPQQVFVILGPNGSGKSTLFKLLSTLMPLQDGDITIDGFSVRSEANAVRHRMGVVFQYPSLDRKLTVRENVECQAALVGLRGQMRTQRVQEVLELLRLSDRTNERAEKLSGGLKRRVELAKGILHRPSILLLDEPSTGLDPSARLDYWAALQELKNQFGTTVVMTTHLLEEADKADNIAIFNRGKVVANDAPEQLRRAMGDAVVSIQCHNPPTVQKILQDRFGWTSELTAGLVRIRHADAIDRAAELHQALGSELDSLTIGRPSLEDVFVAKTGETFDSTTSLK